MSTLPSAAARDAYLAWQAEIGGEEVVLVAPWVRRTPATPVHPDPNPRPPASHHAAAQSSTLAAASVPSLPDVNFEPMKPFVVPGLTGIAGSGAAPGFFSEIAEKLAESERSSSRRGASRPPNMPAAAPAPAGLSPLQESLAALKDPDAYWAFLAHEYPRWFAGAQDPVKAQGHASPRLAVVELAPADGSVFAGEAGALFDRMMNAIGLSRDQLYLTSLMKSPPPRSARTWARKDTARMVPVLLRELQLAQCGLVLVMGEACAQALLKTGRPIPDLLKTPVETGGVSLSATWHPEEIRAADAPKESGAGTGPAQDAGGAKAFRPRATQAWEHLQWLRGLLPAQ